MGRYLQLLHPRCDFVRYFLVLGGLFVSFSTDPGTLVPSTAPLLVSIQNRLLQRMFVVDSDLRRTDVLFRCTVPMFRWDGP